MRVRYRMANGGYHKDGLPIYEAECDMSDKKAHAFFDGLKSERYCEWAELVSEDEGSYMDVIDSFANDNARDLYRIDEQMKEIMNEIFI